MDDPSVDANLYGDPSSSILSDQLLADEEAWLDENGSSAETMRPTRHSLDRPYHDLSDEGVRHQSSLLWDNLTPSSQHAEETGVAIVSTGLDMRNLEYVTAFDYNLVCPICHCPFVLPVRLKCDHVFCNDCLLGAWEHQDDVKTCPTCRRRTNDQSITSVPKIVERILEDLVVKCPMTEVGCTETMTRGALKHHLERYCGYFQVDCPEEGCQQKIQRRFSTAKCLHCIISCPDCEHKVMKKDLDDHINRLCEVSSVQCPDCTTKVLRSELQTHILSCPEFILYCTAATYGCDYQSRRSTFGDHISTCPLSKLVPFLETQRARLEEHEAALKYLKHKNSLYEDCLTNVQEALGESLLEAPPLASRSAPFDSTASHLLNLHESLRKEVERVANAVSDLDAKTDMGFLNHSLRVKEDLAHTNAVMGNMRMQLQWLMSSRLQTQQRAATLIRAQTGEAGPSVLSPAGNAGNVTGTRTHATPTTGSGEGGMQPVRRLSDTTRQETKL